MNFTSAMSPDLLSRDVTTPHMSMKLPRRETDADTRPTTAFNPVADNRAGQGFRGLNQKPIPAFRAGNVKAKFHGQIGRMIISSGKTSLDKTKDRKQPSMPEESHEIAERQGRVSPTCRHCLTRRQISSIRDAEAQASRRRDAR